MKEDRVFFEALHDRSRTKDSGSIARMLRLVIQSAVENYLSAKIFISKIEQIIQILNFHPNFGYVWHSVSILKKMYATFLTMCKFIWSRATDYNDHLHKIVFFFLIESLEQAITSEYSMDLLISPCNSINICFIFFEAILGAQKLKIVILL